MDDIYIYIYIYIYTHDVHSINEVNFVKGVSKRTTIFSFIFFKVNKRDVSFHIVKTVLSSLVTATPGTFSLPLSQCVSI